MSSRTWKKVVFASECPLCEQCEEPICEACDEHYADCECPGPGQHDEYEYQEIRGALYARRRLPS